jgi:hypothetical protein
LEMEAATPGGSRTQAIRGSSPQNMLPSPGQVSPGDASPGTGTSRRDPSRPIVPKTDDDLFKMDMYSLRKGGRVDEGQDVASWPILLPSFDVRVVQRPTLAQPQVPQPLRFLLSGYSSRWSSGNSISSSRCSRIISNIFSKRR